MDKLFNGAKRKRPLLLCLIAMLIVIACDSYYEHWDDERTVLCGQGTGIVNDSSFLLTSYRIFRYGKSGAFFGGAGGANDKHEISFENAGLHLLNYKKGEILWQDTVNWDTEINGQLSDSVMYGGEFLNYITFWKIGEKPKKIKFKNVSGNCAIWQKGGWVEDMREDMRIRHWIDGKFIMIPPYAIKSELNTCHYAIIDTTTKELKKGHFDGEYSWLLGCEDINVFNGKIACLKARTNKDLCGIDLVVNGELADSILWDSASWNSEYWKELLAKWHGKQFIVRSPYYYKNEYNYGQWKDTLHYIDANTMKIKKVEPLLIMQKGSLVILDEHDRNLSCTNGDFYGEN